ncbi:MAG: hypothetical protein B7X35_08445 [Halothiobacillus sp. 14-56-357]|nr:MAG: hypothetical protein B7X35_08445 [Halothiobacillus sp. 14-56-357]
MKIFRRQCAPCRVTSISLRTTFVKSSSWRTNMRFGLKPDQTLTEAAEQMALMHAHTLPVVDENGLVLGDVSEWNFLQGYGADTFFSLIFRLMAHDQRFIDYCERTLVREIMTQPAITLPEQGTFADIARAFHQVEEKRLPVVDAQNHLVGVVMRRDFLERFHWEEWL